VEKSNHATGNAASALLAGTNAGGSLCPALSTSHDLPHKRLSIFLFAAMPLHIERVPPESFGV